MTEQATTPPTLSDAEKDFEVGREVAAQLKNLPRDRQERVLRWVAEGLGIIPPQTAPQPQRRPGDSEPPVPADEDETPEAPSADQVDIAAYVREKKPRTDVQFVAVVAHYYRFVAPLAQRRDAIDATIAQDSTRLANRDRLASPLKTLNNAKSLGYLDSSGRGKFAINTVGENLVARALPGKSPDGAGPARVTRGSNRKRSRKPAAKPGKKRG